MAPKDPPAASSSKKEKDSKRKKKKVDAEADDEDGNKSIDVQKTPFQRLWSNDDVIVILTGMVEGIKKGIDPTADLDQFINRIKKSIHVSFNKEQLKDKIRKMRRKYLNNVKRGKTTFSTAHESKSFKLMKQIWGRQEGNDKKGGERKDVSTLANGVELPMSVEEKNLSLFPCMSEKMPMIMGESLLKEGMGLIGDTKAKEMEKKWRKLHVEELEVYLKRNELLHEQAMVFLKALNSSDA